MASTQQHQERGTKQGSGAKIPDKPRDCGPNVDTWPILDTQVGDAPKTKRGEQAKAKAGDGRRR